MSSLTLALCLRDHILVLVVVEVEERKEGEEAGKYAWLIKLRAWRDRLPCLSNPQGRDEAVA
jgi:hypothetical protein